MPSSISSILREISGFIPAAENLLPQIPDSIMALHDAIEDVVNYEDTIVLNGNEYILVPRHEMERLTRAHDKCKKIREMMYSR